MEGWVGSVTVICEGWWQGMVYAPIKVLYVLLVEMFLELFYARSWCHMGILQ